MTDRDYASIWIEELDPPFVRIRCAVYPWQNSTRINRRAAALARNYSRGWHCRHCGELMPVWKRVDAKYCTESCRKMAARQRKGHLNKF